MLVGVAVLVSLTGVADVPRPAAWMVRQANVLRCVVEGGQRTDASDWLDKLAGVAKQVPGQSHVQCAAMLPPHLEPPTAMAAASLAPPRPETVGPPDCRVAIHHLNLPPPLLRV